MGGSQAKIYNEQIKDSKKEGQTSVYRKKGVTKLVESPSENIKSMRDLFQNIKARYGSKDGLGEIIVSKEKGQNGEQIEKRTVRPHTFNQVYEQSYNIGKFIFGKQLFYVQDVYKMRLIGIFSKNKYEWFISDWACALFGITSVPLYETLGVNNLTYCLDQTKMTTLFATNATIAPLLTLQNLGNLKNIISYDAVDQETKNKLKAKGLALYDFWECVKEGSKMEHITNKSIPIGPEDCYTFSYTSGTTGPPKGAMLSNKNMLSCIATVNTHQDCRFTPDDVYLSYLPLPHVMERAATATLFYAGAYVVVSSGNILKVKDDCCTIKVTVLISVPRLFSKIVEAVKSKFQQQVGMKRCLIDMGVSSKLANAKQDGQYSHMFYDKVIFNKVRQGFGGNVRLLVTGSAPLSPQVHVYMKAIMCCPFLEGYGQTESSAAALFTRATDKTYGYLTQVGSGLQVKLRDIPQMRYTSKDLNEDGKPTPRGQLCKRGPQIFMGYYKQPDVTKETIDKDGWLMTGDIAELNPENNSFKIIDRKKNIFKLQQGEYLAPDKIQGVYSKCNLVSQCFLHGDSTQFYAVAVVAPNKDNLLKLAQEKGIKGSFEELCENKEIKKLILTDMNTIGKNEHLHSFEMAKNIYLQPKGFLSRNILTNTMKLIRFQARIAFKKQIEKLYAEGQMKLK